MFLNIFTNRPLVCATPLLALLACGESSPSSSDGRLHDGPTTQDASPGDTPTSPDATRRCFAEGKEKTGEWVRVKAGSFTMGSPTAEPCRDDDETPRSVSITTPFDISAHEVTQAQFTQLMGYNPSYHANCDDCPVEFVSWHEAAAYCDALSAQRGLKSCYRCGGCQEHTRCEPEQNCDGFRLPSEAEWEYAARAGVQSAYANGEVASESSFCMGTDDTLHEVAWYKVNSNGQTHPVGGRAKNAWGLYDMEGNVYEWTADWYRSEPNAGADRGTERSFRGGSWYHNAHHARLANRERFDPGKRFVFVGFRCVRSQGGK